MSEMPVSGSPAVGWRDDVFHLDHARLVDALLPAVLSAGRIEMAAWEDENLQVLCKSDDSPVTEADHAAEDVIIAALKVAAPGIHVVGEETGSSVRKPEEGEAFFLVDPLDGTRNFIEHLPEFTVNIGLIRHGRPVFGMIYAPAMKALYATVSPDAAVEVKVACGEAPSGLAECCDVHPMRTRRSDKADLLAFASRSHRGAHMDELLSLVGTCQTKHMGSSLKFCLIARGEGDVYVRHGETSEWDTAAGEAILDAAGGQVTTFDGKSLVYGGQGRQYRNPPFVAWGDKQLVRAL